MVLIAQGDGDPFTTLCRGTPGKTVFWFRMPGSANVTTWNPASGTYRRSEIVAVAGVRGRLDRLPPLPAPHECFHPNKKDSSLGEKSGEKRKRRCKEDAPLPWMIHKDARRLLSRHAICAPATRHNRLAGLVGDGVFHFSEGVLWEIATELYSEASPPCRSDLGVHQQNFAVLFAGMMEGILGSCSPEEKRALERLPAGPKRDVFRIARNFAAYAQETKRYGNQGEFPLSGRDLAQRLQIGRRSAYYHRDTLVDNNYIKKVKECVRARKAEELIWLLPLG